MRPNSPYRKRLFATAFMALPITWLATFYPPSDAARVVGRVELGEGHFRIELLTPKYVLDRRYQSMQGPRGNHPSIRLHDDFPADKTVWLTGIDSSIVHAETLETISPEFFCHSNLTLNPDSTSPERHNNSFSSPKHLDWRLFSLIPGRLSIHFPEGFGIPVKNGTMLDHYSMVLNHRSDQVKREVRLRTFLSCQLQTHDRPLRPLFRRSLYVYQQHEPIADASQTSSSPFAIHHGERCAESCSKNQTSTTPSTFANFGSNDNPHPGASCCVANASDSGVVDQFGRKNTVHWMVPPGKHQYRTEVTEQMDLPFDTTAHYVTGHLHPYGQYIELVELETGQVLFHISSRDFTDRLGVEHVAEIESDEGIGLQRGRRYVLVSQYDNTTNQPIDAMAILYVYALDQPTNLIRQNK